MINRQFQRGTQFKKPAITLSFPDGVFWVRWKKGMMAAGFLGLDSTLIKNVVTVIIKGGLTGYQYC